MDVITYERLKAIHDLALETFQAKNKDYGNSVEQGLNHYGVISALVRMYDKWNRIDNLLYKNTQPSVSSETVIDTLIDLANYAYMLAAYLHGKEEQHVTTREYSNDPAIRERLEQRNDSARNNLRKTNI